MMQLIDRLLNKLTMYRVTLYYLAALLALGVILSAFGAIAAKPLDIVSSTALLLAVCYVVNVAISRIMRIHSNPESSLITALIMALIMGPVPVLADPRHALILVLSGVVAVASKYLLAIKRQHIFNPAAAGALFSGLVFGSFASWWVGSLALLPLVVIGGLLLIRKISRLRLAGVFVAAFIVFNIALALIQGLGLDMVLQSLLFVFSQTSLLFFLVVMFTEPMTSPKRFSHQVIYAAIVAFLYQPQLAIAGQNLTPEEALLIGNLFSFIVSPSFKLRLTLKESAHIGEGMMSFTFEKPKGFTHRLGQYMEWSLPLIKGDSRGNRRHFSIASSPTEPHIMIAARFYPNSSAYKRDMQALGPGDPIMAGELGGDFVLPRDPSIPLAFIAGGIGITPFRSMIKYLVDTGEKRDVVLLYSNYAEKEIVFRDVFDEAKKRLGLKVVYTLTDVDRIRPDWCGARGFIDKEMIAREVPSLPSRLFYVSGSPVMVNVMKNTLRGMGVARRKVRSDYFPGYSS